MTKADNIFDSLSQHEYEVLCASLVNRDAPPEMASAMLRRTLVLSLRGKSQPEREEMGKLAMSLSHIYPHAVDAQLVLDYVNHYAISKTASGIEFEVRLEGLVSAGRWPVDDEKRVFGVLFETACRMGSLSIPQVMKQQLSRAPQMAEPDLLSPHFVRLADCRQEDAATVAAALAVGQQMAGFRPMLAGGAMLSAATACMGDVSHLVVTHSTSLVAMLAEKRPELFTPRAVDAILRTSRIHPAWNKDHGILNTLNVLLGVRGNLATAPALIFLADHLFGSYDEDARETAGKLLGEALCLKPDQAFAVADYARYTLGKSDIVSWERRISAVEALKTAAAANPATVTDATILSLACAGSKDGNPDVRDSARDALAKMLPQHGGSRKHAILAATETMKRSANPDHAESARRTLTILLENHPDGADDEAFNVFRENCGPDRPIPVRLQCLKLMFGMIAANPDYASAPFLREIQAMRESEKDPALKLVCEKLFESTLRERPDLCDAFRRNPEPRP